MIALQERPSADEVDTVDAIRAQVGDLPVMVHVERHARSTDLRAQMSYAARVASEHDARGVFWVDTDVSGDTLVFELETVNNGFFGESTSMNGADTTTNTKKVWVAAFDMNGQPGTDPSHAAFYLPAQELLAGNAHAYWVLDPCKSDGTSCESGDECCGGHCGGLGDGGAPVCGNPSGCSGDGDVCSADGECCNGLKCYAGHCAVIIE